MKLKKVFFTIGKNTLIQMIGKILSVVISLISIVLLTRYLGIAGYGNFTLVFTYAGFFSTLADFGLQVIVVRELSGNIFEKQTIRATFFWIKLLLVIVSIFIGISVIPFLPYTIFLKTGIIIGLFAVGVGGFQGFSNTLLQAEVRLDIVTFIDSITKLATFCLLILFILFHLNLLIILTTVLIGNSIGLLVSLVFVNEIFKQPISFNVKIAKKILLLSIPIGFSSFIALLYFKVDTFLLSLYRASAEVGIYSFSYKILENLLVLWGFYMASVFPLLTKLKTGDKKKFTYLLRSTFIIAISSSIVITFCVYFLSPIIVYFLGGVRFTPSIPLLRVLVFSLPFLFINNSFYFYFFIENRFSFFVYSISAAFILNIIINLLIIPKYGYMGASISTVITEIVLFMCLFILFIYASKKEKT